MLGLYHRFQKGQFVQEISFKHDGLPRKDMGIEKFGFIHSHAIVARNYHEYNIVYAGQTGKEKPSFTLDYCLRPLTEDEVLENLGYIANHQADFKHFIFSLNNCDELSAYHIDEADIVKAYRSSLTKIDLTVDGNMASLVSKDTEESVINNVMMTT